MYAFLVAALCFATPAFAQVSISVDRAAPPAASVLETAIDVADRLTAFDRPANLSPTQAGLLAASANAFLDGREDEALAQFAQAVTEAALDAGAFGLSAEDTETLALVVVTQVAGASDEELQTRFDEIALTNLRKLAVSAALTRSSGVRVVGFGGNDGFDQAGAAGIFRQVDVRSEALRVELAALEAASAAHHLDLVEFMERRQTTLAILSNLLKKTSDTASTIVSNLK